MDTLISKVYSMIHLQLFKWYIFPLKKKKNLFFASDFVS